MTQVIKDGVKVTRVSFANGNYFIGDASSAGKFTLPEFNATSREIEPTKSGPNKSDVIKITATERTAGNTRAGTSKNRKLTLTIPAALAFGEYDLKGADGTSFGIQEGQNLPIEPESGTVTLLPSPGNLIKGEINALLETPGSNGETFLYTARFQVLKAG
jgi:hypothetical protein